MLAVVVSSSRCAFRVGAVPEAVRVELSINGKAWRPCREAWGLWWYVCESCPPGNYKVQARILKEKGEITETLPRRFAVKY